jgi:hypothetical protein
MPINTLYKPIGISIVLASIIYMLLMPKLTGFDELAIVIFLVTFLICYLFYQPQQAMGRSFGICLFFAVTAITNDQVYSFLAAANMGLMFALVLFLLVVTAHFPVSNLPQKTFMRLLDRFIASAEFLAQHSRPHSLSARYQIAFHRYELSSLPGKLAAWKPRVPPDLLVSVQDELDVLLVQLGSAGEVLLQEETPDPQNPVDKLADDYAMIDLLPLREARF